MVALIEGWMAKKKIKKQAATKKPAAQKTAAKKAVTKRAATKKASTKTAATKKATTKKATTKKATTEKATTKKATTKKATTKKATTKKATIKKATIKKATTKKAATKKAATKKAATKKAAAKKVVTKKAATEPTLPKTATVSSSPTTGAAVAEAKPATGAAHAPAPALPPPPADPTIDLAQGIAALALDKKAEDVVILQVSDLTSYADCFVLASAPSERQVQAIARHVDDEMRKAGKAPVGMEGLEQGHWVLVDLGAAVLHVFLSSARQYYDLEGFWADAPRIGVDEARGKDVVASMAAGHAERRAAAAAGE